MYKTLFKYLLVVCAVLMMGQVEIRNRPLGGYFASGVKAFGIWAWTSLATNPTVAKVIHPKGLSQWFPLGEKGRAQPSIKETRAGIELGSAESIQVETEEERDEDTDIINEFSEKEIEPDDTAVMSILP
jgi:hypothetical protein